MNVEEAYNRWSTTYDSDRNLTRDLDQIVTSESLAGLTFKAILELGCGTGKNTSFLANMGEGVLALDFSAGMLSQARAKSKFEHVSFAVADLSKDWPCRSQSFGLVVCNLVLEHFPDLSIVFSEAHRVLLASGQFFISELHPYRQYQGNQARFQNGEKTTEIQAFKHNVSDFTDAAAQNGLILIQVKEWWHQEDQGQPPRLISFMFQKKD